MEHTLPIIYTALGIIFLICTIVGIGVKWILLPYLRTQFIAPIQEVRTQVSVNGGTHETPTVPDRIEAVAAQVREARDTAQSTRRIALAVRDEVIALARMFDGHLEWSQREVDRLDKRISRKRKDDET